MQASIPQSYFASETSDEMGIRHQKEILELQNAHLIQKKLLLDKKHNSLLSFSQNTHPLTPINQLRNTGYIGNDTPIDPQDTSNQFKSHAIFSMQSNRFLNEFNSISPISSGSWDQQFPSNNAPFGGNLTNAQLPSYNTVPLSGLISPYEQHLMYGGNNLPSENVSGDFLNSVINKLQSQNNGIVEEGGSNNRPNQQQHNEMRGGVVSPKNGLQNEQNYQGVSPLDGGNLKKVNEGNFVTRVASPKHLQGGRNFDFAQINSNPNSKPANQAIEQPKKQESRPPVKTPSMTDTADPKSGGLPSGVNSQPNVSGASKTEQIIDNERKDTAVSSNSSSPNSFPSKTHDKDPIISTATTITSQNIEEKTKNITKPLRANLVIETADNPNTRLAGQSKDIPRVEIEINNYISPKHGQMAQGMGIVQNSSPLRENSSGTSKQSESMVQKGILSPTAAESSMKKPDFFANKGQKVPLSVIEKLKVNLLLF